MKNKKGVANILVVIIIIIIVLVVISIIWSIVKGFIKENVEVTEVQAQLMREEIVIKGLEGDFVSPDVVNLTLNKGPMKIIGESVVSVGLNADVVSVLDVSNTMNIGTRFEEMQNATKYFIDSVLLTEGNRIGWVVYDHEVIDLSCQELSDDAEFLKNEIDNLENSTGATCICCGVNKAIDYLKNSENIKIMVVMSDGSPTHECTPWQGDSPLYIEAKGDAIQFAADAYNIYNIKVYTIGFGSLGLDEDTLISIAEVGHGEYYYSNISELEDAYLNVSEEIKKYISQEFFAYLKVIFYNETGSYEKQIGDILEPLETRTYHLDLNGEITNVNRVEVYAIAVTKSGKEVGRLLDVLRV